MADKPKNNLPKVPPFIIPGASNQYEEKPPPQAAHVVQAPKSTANNDKQAAQQGMFGSLILLISVISLGVAMISGAWFAYGVLKSDSNEDKPPAQTTQPQDNVPPATTDSENNVPEETADSAKQSDILSKIIVVGLTFAVGWIFSAIGIRSLGNLILPYAIQIYTWVVLGGIIILQVLIMVRLYRQEYQFFNYMKYLSLFGAGLIALVGLHLLLEKHSLVPFGFIILLASLGHLYTIVYHYIFETEVIYSKVWGDIIFFFVTTLVSILMMAHLGLLNGMRKFIDRTFSPKDNQFVP
jgi:predicted tellurium resistance membrane protein TerC